jgi:hypothetical protein
LFTEKFATVGLKMSVEKTEAMIMESGEVSLPISKEAYHHRIAGAAKSWLEKLKEKIICNLFGAKVSR